MTESYVALLDNYINLSDNYDDLLKRVVDLNDDYVDLSELILMSNRQKDMLSTRWQKLGVVTFNHVNTRQVDKKI